jgi:hypothetical protein
VSAERKGELDSLEARLKSMANDKAHLEAGRRAIATGAHVAPSRACAQVKLMITRKKDKERLEALKQKEEELRQARAKAAEFAKETTRLHEQFREAEEAEKKKMQEHHDTISKITNQLKARTPIRTLCRRRSHTPCVARCLRRGHGLP